MEIEVTHTYRLEVVDEDLLRMHTVDLARDLNTGDPVVVTHSPAAGASKVIDEGIDEIDFAAVGLRLLGSSGTY